MKYIIALFSFTWTLGVQAEGTFDASCFRQVATIEVSSGITSIGTRDTMDDIFFVGEDRTILPSRQESTQKNPPLRYTTTDPIDINYLDDTDPYTGIDIDPIFFTKGNVSYSFDLGKVYPRGTIVPQIGYITDRKVSIDVSVDGITFVPVSALSIEEFDLRFLRITFSGSGTQSGITRFHTLNFFQRVESRYLFSSAGGKISLYRSYACQQGKYMDFLTARPMLSFLGNSPKNTLTVTFDQNPEYRDDSDSDGVENLRDNCPRISNPDQADRNSDGIGDICSDDDMDSRIGENDNCPTVANTDQADRNVNGIGDACEFDSDGDGVSDSIDNAIHIKNPDQNDGDRDSIGDVLDNCSLFNPDQLDLDKNGIGDTCDRDREYKSSHDDDRDGVLDLSDNCSKVANPDQTDTDGDGRGDFCDNCRELKNNDQSDENKNGTGDACEDMDVDSIVGWRDNCPKISNPEQTDSDNNGIGDACSDIDGDSKYDAQDVCPTIYDPDQLDLDHDGVGNVCDSSDDRFLESNKYVFMALIAVFGLFFIGAIIFLIRKLQ